MPIWKKPWFSLSLVTVLVMAFAIGCTAQPRPNDDTTPPAPTRAPGDNTTTDGNTTGPNDRGLNDARNNLGLNRNRGNTDWNDGNRANTNWNDDVVGNDNYSRNANRNNMRLADDIANRLTNIRGVDAATVMLSGNNAYVAVDMEGDRKGRVTDKIKDRIADEVRDTDRSINNVYVSADPDFFDRMGGYARDIRNGAPIGGLFDEVNETLRRVFPTAK